MLISKILNNSPFLFLQLILYLSAIAVSAGGSNHPGVDTGILYYFKGLALLIPIIILMFKIMPNPGLFFINLKGLCRNNSFLIYYFLVALVSILFSNYKLYSISRLSYTSFEFISCSSLILQFFLVRKSCTELFNSYIFMITIFTCITLIFIKLFIEPDVRYYLTSNFSIHPNIIAAFCAYLLIFNISKFNPDKIVSYLYIFLLLSVHFILFSRSVIISFIILLTLYPFIKYITKKSRVYLIQSLLHSMFISVGIFSLYLNPNYIEYFLSLITRNDDINSLLSLTNRTYLWSELFQNINSKVALLGLGYSIIDENFGVDFGSGILYGAHNMYLSVLLGSGIFALAIIILYLIKIIHSCYRRTKNEYTNIVLFSSIFFLINSMTSEEIGINMSLSFSFIYIVTNLMWFTAARRTP